MRVFRFFRYKYLLSNRRKRYASLALSIALAHASFGHVRYRSIGNGMADITLSLQEDQKFTLNLDDVAAQKKVNMKGKWTMEGDHVILKFRRAKRDLRDLFTGQTGFSSYAEIENARTVKFPHTRAGLMINGIYCRRHEG